MVIEYRPIPSAPGYLAGADGSIIGKRGHPLKQGANLQGRPQFAHWIPGKGRRTADSHRAICEAFHGPCPAGMEVAHLNGNRADNRPANLQWKTRADNMADKIAHGTDNAGERHYACRISDEDVLKIRTSTARGVDLAARYGVSATYIYLLRTGRRRGPEAKR